MALTDIPVGKVFTSPGRTITEGEFHLILDLFWMTQRRHTDKEYMKGSAFGERLFAGPCVLATFIGLDSKSGWLEAVDRAGFGMVAVLGIEEVRFKHPVHPGDTLTSCSQIVEARPSAKKPKRIVLKRKVSATNQRGEAVAQCFMVGLYEAKE